MGRKAKKWEKCGECEEVRYGSRKLSMVDQMRVIVVVGVKSLIGSYLYIRMKENIICCTTNILLRHLEGREKV